MPLVLNIRGPPNSDFVVGYPGIDATWPRLVGTVEVRSVDGKPFRLKSLSIQLYRTETIQAPSGKIGINQARRVESYIVGHKLELYNSEHSPGKSFLAVDIPFIYTLTSDKGLPPASICIPKIAQSLYRLYAMCEEEGKRELVRTYCPITILRYDTMSSFIEFQEEHISEVNSLDSIVSLRVKIEKTSFGPGDPVVVEIGIFPNRDWQYKSKKVKIQQISLKFEEKIALNVAGDDPVIKLRTIHQEKRSLGNIRLPELGYKCKITTSIPILDRVSKDNLLVTEEYGYPNVFTQALTTTANLFSVKYSITVQAKLSNCKDTELKVPIYITPFDKNTCTEMQVPLHESLNTAFEVAQAGHNLQSTFIMPNDSDLPNKLGIISGADGRRHIYIE
ncbi:hypothetical protein V1511DRAFT_511684 [Dipodascopsis uninucleata]